MHTFQSTDKIFICEVFFKLQMKHVESESSLLDTYFSVSFKRLAAETWNGHDKDSFLKSPPPAHPFSILVTFFPGALNVTLPVISHCSPFSVFLLFLPFFFTLHHWCTSFVDYLQVSIWLVSPCHWPMDNLHANGRKIGQGGLNDGNRKGGGWKREARRQINFIEGDKLRGKESDELALVCICLEVFVRLKANKEKSLNLCNIFMFMCA